MRVNIDWHEGNKYRVGIGSSELKSHIPVCVLDKQTGKRYFRVGSSNASDSIRIRFCNKQVQVSDLLRE